MVVAMLAAASHELSPSTSSPTKGPSDWKPSQNRSRSTSTFHSQRSRGRAGSEGEAEGLCNSETHPCGKDSRDEGLSEEHREEASQEASKETSQENQQITPQPSRGREAPGSPASIGGVAMLKFNFKLTVKERAGAKCPPVIPATTPNAMAGEAS